MKLNEKEIILYAVCQSVSSTHKHILNIIARLYNTPSRTLYQHNQVEFLMRKQTINSILKPNVVT